jgi:hypothetical protein
MGDTLWADLPNLASQEIRGNYSDAQETQKIV